jgi:hypothetical protein
VRREGDKSEKNRRGMRRRGLCRLSYKFRLLPNPLPEITILQLIYQQKAYEGHAKDYEFSGTSMREHWQSGYEDTKRTLKKQEWLRMPVEGAGIVVHDVHRESDR